MPVSLSDNPLGLVDDYPKSDCPAYKQQRNLYLRPFKYHEVPNFYKKSECTTRNPALYIHSRKANIYKFGIDAIGHKNSIGPDSSCY